MSGKASVEHPEKKSRFTGGRALLTFASFLVIVMGLKLGASLLVPIACAFFLSILSFPLMNWLMRKGLPHSVSLVLTLLSIVVALGLMVYMGSVLTKRLWAEIPDYANKVKTQVDHFGGWLEAQGVKDAKVMSEQVYDAQAIVDFAKSQDVMKSAAGLVGTTFGTVATFLTSLGITLIVMLFILMEAPGTQSRAEVVKHAGGPDFTALLQSATDIQKYLGVKTLISIATGVLAALWCWMFGLKYPLLWGLLAFIFNYIPAVGSTAAGLPAIIEAFVLQGVGSAIGIGIGYALINFALDSLIQPMLMGRRFGISGLVVVLSVIFWGWLWGPFGMFLAVPLTMMIKVILENTDEFAWISVAMAKKKVKHGEVILETAPEFDPDLLGGGAATEAPTPPIKRKASR